MKVAVVILNWNTKDYLRSFLPKIIASTMGLDGEVVVADSASTDGSVEMMASLFPGVRLIALEENFGFTGGYNRALAQVDAEYFLLINSDILVAPGWLEPLVSYMDSHPGCGVCGPKLHALVHGADGYEKLSRFEYAGAAGGRLDFFGYPFCRGRVLQLTEEDEGQYDSPSGLLWVSGACLLTRASLWRDLGGLDERFFAHMEEIDYCWRAQLRGWQVAVVPQSVVWHLGGGTLAPKSPWKLELNHRNNLLLLENNLPATVGRTAARLRIFCRMLLDGASALVYLLQGRPADFRAVVRAHRGYRQLRRPSGVSGRAEVKGYYNILLILHSFLYGGGIFKFLRRYEDSH